jgi:nicotinate-nucleotide adenylyltransferase
MSISNLRSLTSIGILGGTFDPPHIGHLLIAQEALTQLNLSQVLFAPTCQPPHKLGKEITPVEHRVEMVRLAITNHPKFALSRIDADRVGPTYTVDTMRMLREQTPAAEFYFIMGMDSLANLATWHQPDELIRLCKLAVCARPGFTIDMDSLERGLPGLSARVVFVRSSALDVSATELQQRVRAGKSIAECVPAAVASYITAHGLYCA